MAGLMEDYRTRMVPELMKRCSVSNIMAVPKLVKVIINMRIDSGVDKNEALEEAVKVTSVITGQKPAATKARKSVSGFKIREGDIVGCRATLRGRMMYEFLERLINAAMPRVRDFRGLNLESFDGRGNYNMGIDECLIFPELGHDEVKGSRGMDVTIVTTSKTDDGAIELLRMLGMPFREEGGGQS